MSSEIPPVASDSRSLAMVQLCEVMEAESTASFIVAYYSREGAEAAAEASYEEAESSSTGR